MPQRPTSDSVLPLNDDIARDVICDVADDILSASSARLVLDTNVVVCAVRSSGGPSGQLLDAARRRQFRMVLTVALTLEYEAVITREEHLAASGMSKSDVLALLNEMLSLADLVECPFSYRPTLPDPEDEMVLEAAINGYADLLVTRNVRHFLPEAETFELRVVSPSEAIRWLEEHS